MSHSLQSATLTSETRVASIEDNIKELRATGYLGELSTEVMKKLQSQLPELNQYIGYSLAGSGLGYYSVSTLTFEGIQKTLDLLKINATVANTFKEIQSLVPKENGRSIMITDKGLFQGKRYHHAIALYIEKRGNEFITFVDDCEQIHVEDYYEGIKKLFPESAKVIQVYCGITRQKRNNVCSSFAINTAAALDRNPTLIKELFKRNRVQSLYDRPQIVTNLPLSITHLDISKASEHQIEFQATIAESLIVKDYEAKFEFFREPEPPVKKTCTRKFLETIGGMIRLPKG